MDLSPPAVLRHLAFSKSFVVDSRAVLASALLAAAPASFAEVGERPALLILGAEGSGPTLIARESTLSTHPRAGPTGGTSVPLPREYTATPEYRERRASHRQ